VLQQCEVGATDWSEVATGGETEPQHPAPFIVLTEPSGDAVGHSHSAADSATVATTASTAAASNSDDIVARILGIGGLILGTVGVIVGLQSRRKEASK
jgi:hypothetical protein